MAIAAIATAGCGRLGFDAVSSMVDGATPDAPFTHPAPSSQADCPANYTFERSSCYRYEGTNDTDWLTAERICEGEGGHIVVVDDDMEANIVDGMMDPNNIEDWHGSTARVTPGVFLTVTGAPQFPPFAAGEPVAGLDCAQFTDSRELETKDCLGVNHYACELDGIPVDRSTY